MDCRQALELITPSLDGELDTPQDTELHKHLAACSRCRNEIELERMTKQYLRRRIPHAATPSYLASRITERIARQSREHRPGAVSPWQRLVELPLRKTIFALGGAVAVLVIMVVLLPSGSRHSHTVPNDGSIINQTYSSFDGLMKGSIVPQISSSDPAAVKAFFSPKVNFNVDVPDLKSCTLMGGVFSSYQNEGVAQVIYKHGDDIIYLYEASLTAVIQGGALNLPQTARDEIARTGYYVESHAPDCTLIAWKADSGTVACAVAEMSKEQLLACLKDAY